jgi:hypothetical protein
MEMWKAAKQKKDSNNSNAAKCGDGPAVHAARGPQVLKTVRGTDAFMPHRRDTDRLLFVVARLTVDTLRRFGVSLD